MDFIDLLLTTNNSIKSRFNCISFSILGVDTVILCGLETHVCILATCQDLLRKGFKVHVVSDACSSRSATDRHFALETMRQIGAVVTTTECVALALVGDAKHPKFKEVQGVIKDVNGDTGLIWQSNL